MARIMQLNLAAGTLLWCVATVFTCSSAFAQSQSNNLSGASLEDLTQLRISVSSFARKDEDLWKTPAAVFVITKEDIAQSSVSSVPELLRMVPGLQVAQLNASTWAVSARGFHNMYANKLLVLIDGRTVFSEIYSGVQWDEINLPLEDIERIEVVRGPGAAVWGTNAVNGVINIITKQAHSMTGLHASGSSSRIEENVNIQYGGTLGQQAQYGAFANYLNREPFDTVSGKHAFDGEDIVRGGGRLDWQKSQSDWITTNGDLYGGHLKEQILAEIALPLGPHNQDSESIAGGHILSRWEHKFNKSDTALQAYYNDESRHELAAYLRTRTIDMDYQDHIVADLHNDLVWGSEVRFTSDHIKGVLPTALPEYRNYLVDGFVQDEITVVPNRFTVTLGSKVQDGTLAGVQIQPSARLLWTPTETQSFWAAVSRAAVAPSLQDIAPVISLALGSIDLPQPLGTVPLAGVVKGNPAFKPETVLAYELGYRRRVGSTLSIDLATFINNTKRLQSLSVSNFSVNFSPQPIATVDLLFVNGPSIGTAGVEGNVSWKPLNHIFLQGSYTWMQAHTNHASSSTYTLVDSWDSPRNTFAGSASWNFAQQWSASSFVYYVDSLASTNITVLSTANSIGGNQVQNYTRLDFHLTRNLSRSIELDASATNLLTPRHIEFEGGSDYFSPAYVPRSISMKATWSF